jgi:hypothetical protein
MREMFEEIGKKEEESDGNKGLYLEIDTVCLFINIDYYLFIRVNKKKKERKT